jgi:hypothetical protein
MLLVAWRCDFLFDRGARGVALARRLTLRITRRKGRKRLDPKQPTKLDEPFVWRRAFN